MPGRCGRCGKYVGAAEERRALGKSFHMECFTCAICHRGLDSMTVAEHRELNEIYCKSCYRLYIGPDGYGYPPNGPALISYDMEHQDPPPGSEVKWRTPPTRLGKVFWRPKTLPSGQTSIGSRVIGKSNTKIQSHSGVKGQGSGFKGQGSVHASSSRSKTSSHSRPDSPRPISPRPGSPRPGSPRPVSDSRIPPPPPLPPPPPPSGSAERVRSQNSKNTSNHSTHKRSSHKISGSGGIPPPPPLPDWTDSKGNHHSNHSKHGAVHNSHHSPVKSHSNQSPVHSNHSHQSPVHSHHSPVQSNHSHSHSWTDTKGNTHSSHSRHGSMSHSTHSPVHSNHNNSGHRVFSPSKIPPPPPLPPPPPPGRSGSGKLSQHRVSRSPSPKKSRSGHTHTSHHAGQRSSSKSNFRSRSHSPVKSRSNSGNRSRSKSNTAASDPNCPPLFYCGGKCVGTPSYPRYPPHHNDARRIPLGPSYGAVRGVPKGIGEKCRRCGRPVFQAELQLGYHGAYHTECFTCCGCGKKLDSTTVAEHQGEIFCKGCYRRNFATSGVGFGIGAGALQTP